MGLDTLDEFSPRDTDPVSLGDDAIRATRAATKQSFGLEHYLDGAHKIPSGTQAARPAAGRVGRVYFNTDTNGTEFDNGTQWITRASVKALSGSIYNPATRSYGQGIKQEVVMPQVWVDSSAGALVNAPFNQVHGPNYACWATVSGEIQLDGNGASGQNLNLEWWNPAGQWNILGTLLSADVNATTFVVCVFRPIIANAQFRLTYRNVSGSNRNMSWASLSIGILGPS